MGVYEYLGLRVDKGLAAKVDLDVGVTAEIDERMEALVHLVAIWQRRVGPCIA
jgi:hypothetical protein